jgi:hypothetical protein
MNKLVEIASVFRAVWEKKPLPPSPIYDGAPPLDWLTERHIRMRHVRDLICDELHKTGEAAVLVSAGQRHDVPASDLHKAHPAWLADTGTLNTQAWNLRAYAKHGSHVIYVPEGIKDRAVRAAGEELGFAAKRGAPRKVDIVKAAYDRRFPSGHDLEGVNFKNVAHEIGLPSTSDRTLRRAISGQK